VEAVKIVNDFNTGKSRGFGFVEVATREEMEKETKRLHGFLFKGRNLVVGEAKANLEKAEKRHATHA
jgi:RNA recognition motif-containing protein